MAKEPILLFRPIFEEVAEDITKQLIQSREKVVDIWMNTPGGSISAGWSILAALNETEKEANMTVLGDADSFGFIMLLFGKKNKAFDTSSFLVHRAASYWEEVMTDEELQVIEDRNKVIRQKMEDRLDKDKFEEITGSSFDDIFSMDDRLDVNLNAEQAKEIGLIDEIVTLDARKKKEYKEIESRYYKDIAALSSNKINNSNKNKMGKLNDLIFGAKDPLLTASIGDRQFVYGKLEKGSTIKAIGEGEQPPIDGEFEVNDKIVTVVANEITAVNESDKKQKQIDALKAELKALKDNQLTAEEVAEVVKELSDKNSEAIEALKAENEALKETLAQAKITVSSPTLPEGEFDNADNKDSGLTLRERIAAAQKKAHEDKIKEREV
jgi:ATP-dependent Clp protease protease subunit